VHAARAEIIVRGTRFRVELGESESSPVSVSVERGRVEVRTGDDFVRQLGPGESWSAAAHVEAPAAPSPEPEAEAVPQPAAPPRWSVLLKAHKPREAYDALGPQGFARELKGASAVKLLDLASVARLSGRAAEAAEAFDALRRRHRDDPRAGLAALELGRLRLDALGDPAGAEEAFADALVLSPGAPFAEDVRARRIQALDEMGDLTRCRKAKDDYLRRYPAGSHLMELGLRCTQ
jgi:hypothetical protein